MGFLWLWDILSFGAFRERQSLIARSWFSLLSQLVSSDFGNIFDQNAFLKAEPLASQTGLQVAAVSSFPALTLCPRVFRVLNCILCTRVISYSLVGCIFNGLSLLAGDHLLGATFSTLGTFSYGIKKNDENVQGGQERRQH